MTVTLPPDLAGHVEELVDTRMFATEIEVIRAALTALEDQMEYERKFHELRAEIDKGIASAEAGHVKPFNEAAIQAILARLDGEQPKSEAG